MTSALWVSGHGRFSTVLPVVPSGIVKQSPTLRSFTSALLRTANTTTPRNTTMAPMMRNSGHRPRRFAGTTGTPPCAAAAGKPEAAAGHGAAPGLDGSGGSPGAGGGAVG